MADEVINAGRFDQRTTQEERRITLEALLHDEDRYQRAVHDVPSMEQINRMIARTDDEVALFDKMDEEEEWPRPLLSRDEIPAWLKSTSADVDLAMNARSKEAMKRGLSESIAPAGSEVALGRGHRQANKLAALTEEEPSSQALPRDDEDEEALYGEEEDTWKKAVPEDEDEPSLKRPPPEEDEPEPSISIPPSMKKALPDSEDFEEVLEEARSFAAGAKTGPGKPPRSGKRSPAKRSRSSLGKKSPVGTVPGAGREGLAGAESPVETEPVVGGKGLFKAGKSRLGLERFQEREPASEPEEGEIKGEDSAEEGEVRGQDGNGAVDVSEGGPWGGEAGPPGKAFGGKGFMGVLTGGDSRDGFADGNTELEEGEIEEGEIPAGEDGGNPGGERSRPCDGDELKRKKKKRRREGGGHSKHGDEGGAPKKITLKLPGKLLAKVAPAKANGLRSEKSVKRSRVSDYSDILGLKPKAEQKPAAATESPAQKPPAEAQPPKSNGKAAAERDVTARPMPDDVRKKCRVVLEKLRMAKDKEGRLVAAALLELPSENDAPDYYRVVRTPIDLAAIESRLAGDGYLGVTEFARDVDLMLINAQLYYQKGSQVFSDARKLQKLFFQRMEVTFPDANLDAARVGEALLGASERPGVGPAPEKKTPAPSSEERRFLVPGPEERKPSAERKVPAHSSGEQNVPAPSSKPPATDAGQTKGLRTSYAGSFTQAGQPIPGGIGKVRIRVRTGGGPAPKVQVLHTAAEQPKLVESVVGPPKMVDSARLQVGGGARVSEKLPRFGGEDGGPFHPGDLPVVKKKRRSKEDGGGGTPREESGGAKGDAVLPSESLLGFRPPKKMRSERRPTH
eukprot:TRINITY_DN9285_c0_g4_i1.p1 TRINITY_DN9285_c0_g4~~TRINITY_DN9285_c0_g4_i1.p1  ORF type:complete len:945 (+),score=297.85 TRINITY_DN9285_c0_g4_i1:288-2837(+)